MHLLLVALLSDAVALPLSYRDALDTALRGNATLLIAEQDQLSAEGALLAARGVFEPTLRGSESYTSDRGESVGQFGEVFQDVRSFTTSAGVDWLFGTGTTAGLDLSETRSEVEFILRDFGGQSQAQGPFFNQRINLSLSQSLLQGHRLAYNLAGVRQARQAITLSEAETQRVRQEVLATVSSLYWGLLYQQRLVGILEQSVKVSTEEKRVVELKVQQGTLAPVEATRADQALVQAQQSLIAAREGLRTAEDNLSLALGEAPGTPYELTTAPARPVRLEIDDEEAVRSALAHNPSLAALRLQEQGATADVADARHQLLPQLDAVGSFGLNANETTRGAALSELFSGELPRWSLGANLSVPLGNKADRGTLQSRTATAEKVRLQRMDLERSIAQQVRTQVARIETARSQLDLAEANQRLAEQTLTAERALLDAGRSLQKDVLEAIRAVDNARLDVERAITDYQLAIIELERLKGSL